MQAKIFDIEDAMSLQIPRLAALVCVLGISVATETHAVPIRYINFSPLNSFSLGSVSYVCDLATRNNCANIAITFIGDTSTVTPFSVPGASGFKTTPITSTRSKKKSTSIIALAPADW